LRRREARRDPDGVDTEILQIVEFGGDAVEVANAIVVAVGKTSWIDFIEDGVLPPLVTFGVDRFLLRRCGSSGEATARG
jgi:hypothetical protein